ncbi:MAG: vWA domain-containing protein, partial [Pseudomonadota bacterium]|nr:vWA domain-containing protein [Pseudomonadota bacterium]
MTIVLDNSSSLADANAQDAVADAALAYIDAAFECSRSVYVAVATFSRNFTTVLEHTSDIEQLRAAIEAYRQDAFAAGTTNLFGAYIDALNYSETAQQNYANRMREGVVTFGQVLFFTDGDDNSEARSIEEAQAALARSADEIFMVGLGALDVATLNRLGGGRSVATNDPVQLRQAFRNQVARLQRRQESVYALGYCTPRLGGQHTVEVSIAGSPERLPLFNFDATGWIDYDGPVCQPAVFTAACNENACGGLWCGGCGGPDRSGLCTDENTCTCEAANFQPNTCEHCTNFWSGENCDVCESQFGGLACNVCANNWTGQRCDTCAPNFAGPNCDQCAG